MTMIIKIISGDNHDFLDKAQKIVDIYNAESSTPFNETIDVSKPDSLNLIYIEGIEGGVITDQWHNKNGDFLFHSILFAAFPKNERRKGHLKTCINNANFPIETVQINGGDPVEIWKKLGFTKTGTLGFTAMLRTRDFDEINWGLCILK